ncbi:hypothetical protein [Gilliamella sp. ESL0232]|uniref:hypothetical protein n=1 Tax=Gilliamella sp. ESL0232 TaxID=2705037 RepID=UPI001EECF2F8|nr:hypothetical protein [Gilliamella sp. ESL0232]
MAANVLLSNLCTAKINSPNLLLLFTAYDSNKDNNINDRMKKKTLMSDFKLWGWDKKHIPYSSVSRQNTDPLKNIRDYPSLLFYCFGNSIVHIVQAISSRWLPKTNTIMIYLNIFK